MSAPKTGHQTAAAALIDEALALFFDAPADLHCTPTTGGVNNVTLRIARAPAAASTSLSAAPGPAEEFILRIYNNGNNSAKVAFEHEILEQLAAQSLSFQVPRALRSLVAQRTHERLSSGAECCVFHVIQGRLASTTSPEEVGRAAGELSAALGRVQVAAAASPTPPYFRLFEVHHAFGAGAAARDRFYHALAPSQSVASSSSALSPAADATVAVFPSIDADAALRESIDALLAFIRALELRLAAFEAWALPTTVIHGDLHYDNVLVVGDTVTALLDFEFAAVDWRAMELAGMEFAHA